MGKEPAGREMRNKRKKSRWSTRKTLVKEGGWVFVNGWYLRSKTDDPRLDKNSRFAQVYPDWVIAQRLAHQCEPDKIYAPVGVKLYQKKNRGYSLYGKCSKCSVPICDEVKFLIFLELADI